MSCRSGCRLRTLRSRAHARDRKADERREKPPRGRLCFSLGRGIHGWVHESEKCQGGHFLDRILLSISVVISARIKGSREPSALGTGSAVATLALAEYGGAVRVDLSLHYKSTAGPLGHLALGFPLGDDFPAGPALELDIFGLRLVEVHGSVRRNIVGRSKTVLVVEQR